jgi:hypothetical protein
VVVVGRFTQRPCSTLYQSRRSTLSHITMDRLCWQLLPEIWTLAAPVTADMSECFLLVNPDHQKTTLQAVH